MNDSKKANSNNPLQFYKRNPFKNESDQKKKVHQKIEIAFKFTKEIPLKFIRTKKKLSLKLGLKNTILGS